MSRRPTRSSRIVIAIDFVGTLEQVLDIDQSDQIRQLDEEIRHRELNLRDFDITIGNKERLLQKEQDDFVQLKCPRLGFNHEVLNIRSADEILRT